MENMKTRTREIARVGIFGSKAGPQVVTEKDLKEIEETFAETGRAPVQFGHRADAAAPRLGNVVAVRYDAQAQTLLADIEEHDTLAEAVDAGYYPDVSIGSRQRASDGKMYLRHLAYLGPEAPAVKGLMELIQEPLELAAADTGRDVRVLPGPSEKRLYLAEGPVAPENENPKKGGAEAAASNPPRNNNEKKSNEEEAAMTEADAQALREENERLKKENGEKELALSEASRQRREASLERLKAAMAGHVPKAQYGKVLELAEVIDEGKVIELAGEEAPGGKRKTSGLDMLVEFVSALPAPVETGVMNLSDKDASPAAAAARKKMLGLI